MENDCTCKNCNILRERAQRFMQGYTTTDVKVSGRTVDLKDLNPRRVVAACNAHEAECDIMGTPPMSAFVNVASWLVGRQEAVWAKNGLVEVNRYHIYY